MPEDCTLVLGIVAPVVGIVGEVSDFVTVAEEHHVAERNPWTITTRLLALARVGEMLSREHPGKSIAISAIPRPDVAWETLRSWFPGDRTWIIPDACEEFDEAKAAYFRNKGERIVRFNGETEVDGRLLRARFAEDMVTAASLLPGIVRDVFVDGWQYRQ
jgi:hypothetical protein